MSVDDVLGNVFQGYVGPESLPKYSQRELNLLARYAVSQLSNNDNYPRAEKLLREIDRRISAGNLVDALETEDVILRNRVSGLLRVFGPSVAVAGPLVRALSIPKRSEAARTILDSYEPNHAVTSNLIGAFRDNTCRSYAIQIFERYGPKGETIGPLVRALDDPDLREPAIKLLKSYRPLGFTIEELVKQLDKATAREAATEVLLYYGPSKQSIMSLMERIRYTPYQSAVCDIMKKYAVSGVKGVYKLAMDPLFIGLGKSESRIATADIVRAYRPQSILFEMLVKALSTKSRNAIARELLIEYGRAFLYYVKELPFGSPISQEVKEIVDTIEQSLQNPTRSQEDSQR